MPDEKKEKLSILDALCLFWGLVRGDKEAAKRIDHLALDLPWVFNLLPVEVHEDVGQGTPLHEAVIGGNLAAVKGILEGYPVPDSRDDKGRTPLHEIGVCVDGAVVFTKGQATNAKEIIDKLIAYGAEIDAKDNKGQTPLHKMAMCCSKEATFADGKVVHVKGIADRLLEYGADIDAKDNSGKTPLHTAVEKGNIELAKHLVSKGADLTVEANPTKEGKKGKTPLDYATNTATKNILRNIKPEKPTETLDAKSVEPCAGSVKYTQLIP